MLVVWGDDEITEVVRVAVVNAGGAERRKNDSGETALAVTVFVDVTGLLVVMIRL